MPRQNKSPPEQSSMFAAFEEAAFEARMTHLPSTLEEAIPFYRKLIEKYHAAMMKADREQVQQLDEEAYDLAVELNNGDAGIMAYPEASVYMLERGAEAETGTVPLWGQTGNFVVEPCPGFRARIEMDGIFGIAKGLLPSFMAYAVDDDKPFISKTGFRCFLGWGVAQPLGTTVDAFVCERINDYIAKDLKGKLQPIQQPYVDRHNEKPSP